MVFPLGMYGVGGYYLGQADHLPLVQRIGSLESWVALAAWTLAFVAMLYHLLVTRVIARPAPAQPTSR